MPAAADTDVIDRLCAIDGRTTGTDAERRAANLLAAELGEAGRPAKLEPIYVHPQWMTVHMVHCLLALVGSLVAVREPAAGFALVLFAATSLYLDLETRVALIRRIFFRRGSQNVVSRGRNAEAPVRLLIAAHYDAGRTGYALGPRGERWQRRLPARLRHALGPWRVIFWGGIGPLLPILGARMAFGDSDALDLLQVAPSLLLVIAAYLLADAALSVPSPGAYDNASGVAAALGAAARLDADPPTHIDVWIVLTGGGAAGAQGMRAFMRQHSDDHDPDATAVICLDGVSGGRVHWSASEGAVVSTPMDARMLEIADAIATASAETDGAATIARDLAIRTARITDATAARARGAHCFSLFGAIDGVPPPFLGSRADEPGRAERAVVDAAAGVVTTLVKKLDEDVGRRLTRT